MDYESVKYECDLWQGDIVLTHKATGKCGIVRIRKGNVSGARMLKQDIRQYGEERTLRVYAKLVTSWQ